METPDKEDAAGQHHPVDDEHQVVIEVRYVSSSGASDSEQPPGVGAQEESASAVHPDIDLAALESLDIEKKSLANEVHPSKDQVIVEETLVMVPTSKRYDAKDSDSRSANTEGPISESPVVTGGARQMAAEQPDAEHSANTTLGDNPAFVHAPPTDDIITKENPAVAGGSTQSLVPEHPTYHPTVDGTTSEDHKSVQEHDLVAGEENPERSVVEGSVVGENPEASEGLAANGHTPIKDPDDDSLHISTIGPPTIVIESPTDSVAGSTASGTIIDDKQLEPLGTQADVDVNNEDAEPDGDTSSIGSVSSSLNVRPTPLSLCCAGRDQESSECRDEPRISCPYCGLVCYYNEACRERDWNRHEMDCTRGRDTSVLKLLRTPTDESQQFWAPYAASDVLNLEKNEGSYFDDTLDILLLPDFGLRHVIQTVLSLPDTAAPYLSFSVMERDDQHAMRSVLPLLLLLGGGAEDNDPVLNAEIVIHLWYSARIPSGLWNYLIDQVSDNVVDFRVCRQNDAENKLRRSAIARCGKSTVAISPEYVNKLPLYGAEHSTLSLASASIARDLSITRFAEPLAKTIGRLSPSRVAAALRWEHDGILLPYDYPRDTFDMVNPILIPKDGLVGGHLKEPFSEWPMEVLNHRDGLGPNDVYGQMFFYLRDVLVKFQARAKTIRISVNVQSVTVEETLQPTRAFLGTFDRVEVGSLWEKHPLYCLTTMATHLRHFEANPFAKGLVMCRDSVTDKLESTKKDMANEKQLLYKDSGLLLDKYAPPVSAGNPDGMQAIIRRQRGLQMWRNWEKFSDHHFKISPKFDFLSLVTKETAATRNIANAKGFCGLRMQAKNVITKKWPTRLIHGKKDEPSLESFERSLGWGDGAAERWIEWQKFEDYDYQYVFKVAYRQSQVSEDDAKKDHQSDVCRCEDTDTAIESSAEGDSVNTPDESFNDAEGVERDKGAAQVDGAYDWKEDKAKKTKAKPKKKKKKKASK